MVQVCNKNISIFLWSQRRCLNYMIGVWMSTLTDLIKFYYVCDDNCVHGILNLVSPLSTNIIRRISDDCVKDQG